MADTDTEGRLHRGAGGRKPTGPTDFDRDDKKRILKRTLREFQEDDITDWAAALTYYGVLSLFPALLVLVSLFGLFGAGGLQTLIDNLGSVTPGPAQEIATSAVENLRETSAAGVMVIVGIAAALWSASNYVGAFGRASNAIYDVEEGRPFYKLKPLQMGITLVLLLLVAISALAVVISGPLAESVGEIIGVGDTAVTVWGIAKWPVIAAIFVTVLAFLYYAAPNVEHPRFRWVSPGSLVAVLTWVLASAGFAFYVANFGSYDKVYGALGGVIIFLTWMWISNIAILVGAELNAETERQRQIKKGAADEETEPFLSPRSTQKLDKEREKERDRQIHSRS